MKVIKEMQSSTLFLEAPVGDATGYQFIFFFL